MSQNKKLLGVLSAVIVGAGAAVAAVPANAAVGTPETALTTIAAAGDVQSAVLNGTEADLRAYLQNNPTSELTPEVLDRLLILVGNGRGNDQRGDNGMNGISNANEHGRQSPNNASPNANERALDTSIY